MIAHNVTCTIEVTPQRNWKLKAQPKRLALRRRYYFFDNTCLLSYRRWSGRRWISTKPNFLAKRLNTVFLSTLIGRALVRYSYRYWWVGRNGSEYVRLFQSAATSLLAMSCNGIYYLQIGVAPETRRIQIFPKILNGWMAFYFNHYRWCMVILVIYGNVKKPRLPLSMPYCHCQSSALSEFWKPK